MLKSVNINTFDELKCLRSGMSNLNFNHVTNRGHNDIVLTNVRWTNLWEHDLSWNLMNVELNIHK